MYYLLHTRPAQARRPARGARGGGGRRRRRSARRVTRHMTPKTGETSLIEIETERGYTESSKVRGKRKAVPCIYHCVRCSPPDATT